MSDSHFDRAKQFIAGGVNSPVRAFNGVGGTPIFFSHGDGPYLYDTEGQIYIDYVGSWGPMIVGHAHPTIIQAVKVAAQNGLSFGAPTVIETQMAEKINQLMPSMELMRMVNSGTEATMSAIRLARGYTGRDKIIKFEGCYHGHADSLLVKAGSGALTMGLPSSAGVPGDLAQHTLTCRFNDLASVEYVLEQEKDRIAAIIVEPVAGNMNCIPPKPGFLQGLRQLCDKHGAVLIFDEVMTGFRVHLGGAQALYQVKPDLTTLGKVVGAGLPVGVFGGRRDIMNHLAPMGSVYQAGTLSGNPIAMTAGLTMLQLLSTPGFFEMLSATTQQLVDGLQSIADQAGVPFHTHAVGGMFGFFFTDQKDIHSFEQVNKCNINEFKRFFHGMLAEGIYLAPSAFEAGFVSVTHDDGVIQATLRKAERVFNHQVEK